MRNRAGWNLARVVEGIGGGVDVSPVHLLKGLRRETQGVVTTQKTSCRPCGAAPPEPLTRLISWSFASSLSVTSTSFTLVLLMYLRSYEGPRGHQNWSDGV